MPSSERVLTPARLVYTAFHLLVHPFLLLALAGDWLWPEAWFFAVCFLTYSIYIVWYLNRHSPGLLRERFRKAGTGGQKRWDRYFLYGLTVAFVAWFILMPLDARRFAWSPPFPLWLKAVGFLALPAAFYMMFRALADNPYASPLVRVQEERKQQVVSTGVYGFVRHPMYLGAGLWFLSLPLMLGSLIGLALGALITLMLAGRIFGEEKMLLAELEGYSEYRSRVRYRLIPGVW